MKLYIKISMDTAHLWIFREKCRGDLNTFLIPQKERKRIWKRDTCPSWEERGGLFVLSSLTLGTKSPYLVSGFSKAPNSLRCFWKSPIRSLTLSTHLVRSWPCLSSYIMWLQHISEKGEVLHPLSTLNFSSYSSLTKLEWSSEGCRSKVVSLELRSLWRCSPGAESTNQGDSTWFLKITLYMQNLLNKI